MSIPCQPIHNLKLSANDWNQMQTSTKTALQKLFSDYMPKSRWFRGKAKKIKSVEIKDTIPFTDGPLKSYIFLIETVYIEGKNEQYVVPLSLITGDETSDIKYKHPEALVAYVEVDGHEGILYDGSYNKNVRDLFFQLIYQKEK